MPHKDPEERRSYANNYYSTEDQLAKRRVRDRANSDAKNLWARNKYASNREEIRARKRATQYKVPVDTMKEMLSVERCEITGRPLDAPGTQAIDHSHEHGHVRGVLHARVNAALAWFGDDPELLRAAADYLEERNDPSFEWRKSKDATL